MGNDSQFRVTLRDRWRWASERNEWWSNVRKDFIYPVAVGVVTWAAFLIGGRLDAAMEQAIAIAVAVAVGFVFLPVLEQAWGLLLSGGILRDAAIAELGEKVESLTAISQAQDDQFHEMLWLCIAEGQGLLQRLKEGDGNQMRSSVVNWIQETKRALGLYGESAELFFWSDDDKHRVNRLRAGEEALSEFLRIQVNRLEKLDEIWRPSLGSD